MKNMCITSFKIIRLIGGFMIRIYFFVLGFCLLVFSFSYYIMCLNVLSIGYNFMVMVHFIFRSPTFYLGLIGFFMILFSIIIKGDKKI